MLVAGGGAASETNYGGLFASTISDTLVDFDQFDGSAQLIAGGCAVDEASFNGLFNFDMLPNINDKGDTIGSAI